MYTHGYDFYTITKPHLGTYYGGEKGGKGHFGASPEERKVATARMSTLLRWPNSNQSQAALDDLGFYGLGTRRTLEQYARFSGVDTVNQKLNSTCDNPHVPWDDDSLYSEYTQELLRDASGGGVATAAQHVGADLEWPRLTKMGSSPGVTYVAVLVFLAVLAVILRKNTRVKRK